MVSNYIPKDVTLHAENGMLGFGGYPKESYLDADLINASKETISELPGCNYFKSSDSFAMVRGRKLDVTILGALQVAQNGDLANWIIPGKMVKGMGGAMDLVGAGLKVVITMEHTVPKNNAHKLLKKCTLPITGTKAVSMLITDLGVFDFTREKGITLTEVFKGISVDHIRKATECDFEVANDLKTIEEN